MNAYAPRELRHPDGSASGRWHFTCENDGRVWPVGACAEGCAGHATPEAAREHQRQHLLARARFDGAVNAINARPCEVCGASTTGVASAKPFAEHFLCDAHRNREGLARVLTVPDLLSSW